jgi:hypothetical protein
VFRAHTRLLTGVVVVSLETKFVLAIPPVLLTVLGLATPPLIRYRSLTRSLGVVIGFVISYRAMSGWVHSLHRKIGTLLIPPAMTSTGWVGRVGLTSFVPRALYPV